VREWGRRCRTVQQRDSVLAVPGLGTVQRDQLILQRARTPHGVLVVCEDPPLVARVSFILGVP
jgi:hypothetical protein